MSCYGNGFAGACTRGSERRDARRILRWWRGQEGETRIRGIAVGSGSDIAAETAGIVLVNSNPKDIVSLILFGKATYKKMIQNLAWATGYNVVALPLAAGVLYKSGILLNPATGAVLMSLSTIVVAINASLLKVKKIY